MLKAKFKEGLKKLIMAYPGWKLDYTDSQTVNFWYKQFKDIDSKVFIDGVQKYIQNCEYRPTIAGLKKYMGHSETKVDPGGGKTAEELIKKYDLEG